ncbi:MAG: SMC family ATPase [Nanoarchaeota archaeon]
MKLKSIYLKNIRSYEEQKIVFPEGAVLLSGNVGSGKTTILLALEYALFGLQAGQRGASLLRHNASEAEVILELDISGEPVIIERRLKRDSKSITNDYSAITLNGQKLEYSTTELKTRILELIGYPPEFVKKNNILYKYTVYTPQEQMKQIITEDSETRLSVIRHVFGIDKYRIIRDNLSIIILKLKDETKFMSGELKTLDEEKLKLESSRLKLNEIEKTIISQSDSFKIKKAMRKAIELELLQFEDKIKEKENFEKEAEKTSLLISVKRENLELLEKEKAELNKSVQEDIGFSQTEYNQGIASIASKKALIESLNGLYYNTLSSLKHLEKDNASLSDKKKRFFSIQMCPTCLQDVSPVHRHNILNDTECNISANTKQYESLEKEKVRLQIQISDEKKILLKLEERKLQLESLKSKITYLEKIKVRLVQTLKSIELISKDIILLTQHLSNLKEQAFKLSSLNMQYKKKEDELRYAFNEEKKAEIYLAETNKEIELTRHQVSNLSDSILKKEELQKNLLYKQELISWLSNQFSELISFIEIQVMMKLRKEFNKLFSAWFGMIVPESFEVKLDENFTPLIIQNGVEMEYSFLSGGERTAVALAYRLALNQTINSLLSSIKTRDIIILDEPTEGFSEAQIDKIRDVLEELNILQLILVSHEQKIESFVDHIIRITKHGDSSSVSFQT